MPTIQVAHLGGGGHDGADDAGFLGSRIENRRVGSRLRAKNKPRALVAQHFKRVHGLDPKANAGVGNLNLLGRSGGDLVSHNYMAVG